MKKEHNTSPSTRKKTVRERRECPIEMKGKKHILYRHNDTCLIGTVEGVYRYNTSNKSIDQISRVTMRENATLLCENTFVMVGEDAPSRVYTYSSQLSSYDIPNISSIVSISRNSRGNVCIMSPSRLLVYRTVEDIGRDESVSIEVSAHVSRMYKDTMYDIEGEVLHVFDISAEEGQAAERSRYRVPGGVARILYVRHNVRLVDDILMCVEYGDKKMEVLYMCGERMGVQYLPVYSQYMYSTVEGVIYYSRREKFDEVIGVYLYAYDIEKEDSRMVCVVSDVVDDVVWVVEEGGVCLCVDGRFEYEVREEEVIEDGEEYRCRVMTDVCAGRYEEIVLDDRLKEMFILYRYIGVVDKECVFTSDFSKLFDNYIRKGLVDYKDVISTLGVGQLYDNIIRYTSECIVEDESVVDVLFEICEKGEGTKEMVYSVMREVEHTFDVDRWVSLLFNQKYWEYLESVDGENAFGRFMMSRMRYYMLDMYMYVGEEEEVYEMVVEGVCRVVCESEERRELYANIQVNIYFLFDEPNNIIEMYYDKMYQERGRFDRLREDVLVRCMEMGQFDVVGEVEVESVLMDKCVWRCVGSDNYKKIGEVCRKKKNSVMGRLCEVVGVFAEVGVRMEVGKMFSMIYVEEAARRLYRGMMESRGVRVVYNGEAVEVGGRVDRYSQLFVKLCRDLMSIRLYMREAGAEAGERGKEISDQDDIDSVGMMVEEAVLQNRLESVGGILGIEEPFDFEGVERVLTTYMLKDMVEKDRLEVDAVRWTSSRVEGLKFAYRLVSYLEELGVVFSRHEVFDDNVVAGLAGKVWAHTASFSHVMDVYTYSMKYKMLYVDRGVEEKRTGDLHKRNKQYVEENKRRIEKAEEYSLYRDNRFVRFLVGRCVRDMVEKGDGRGLDLCLSDMHAHGREDVCVAILRVLFGSGSLSLLDPRESRWIKSARREAAGQEDVQSVCTSYVCRFSKRLDGRTIDAMHTDLKRRVDLNEVCVRDGKCMKKNFNEKKTKVLVYGVAERYKQLVDGRWLDIVRHLFIDFESAIESMKLYIRHKREKMTDKEIRLLVDMVSLECVQESVVLEVNKCYLNGLLGEDRYHGERGSGELYGGMYEYMWMEGVYKYVMYGVYKDERYIDISMYDVKMKTVDVVEEMAGKGKGHKKWMYVYMVLHMYLRCVHSQFDMYVFNSMINQCEKEIRDAAVESIVKRSEVKGNRCVYKLVVCTKGNEHPLVYISMVDPCVCDLTDVDKNRLDDREYIKVFIREKILAIRQFHVSLVIPLTYMKILFRYDRSIIDHIDAIISNIS